jgi:hypothetical protein
MFHSPPARCHRLVLLPSNTADVRLLQRSMLAELSARLMDSRAAENINLGMHVEEGAGPDDGPARLVIGDDCSVM